MDVTRVVSLTIHMPRLFQFRFDFIRFRFVCAMKENMMMTTVAVAVAAAMMMMMKNTHVECVVYMILGRGE